MKIHLGFLTNNAGDDIAGSTIKWTIKTFHQYFDSVIVVDGRLTEEARQFYVTIPNIVVKDSPWTGRHVDQYIVRNQAIDDGDWMLALDCDEAPSNELAIGIKEILKQIPSNIDMIRLPTKQYWSKNNSDLFYSVAGKKTKEEETGCKNILYKKTKDLLLHQSKNGTHVSFFTKGNIGLLHIPYLHFKSPETIIFNMCICLMDELREHNRNIDKKYLDELESIGNKYGLLTKESFRIATKNKTWPIELIEFAIKTKDQNNDLKYLYDLYFVIMKANDTYKSYEDICNIGDMNINYSRSILENDILVIPHTDVLLNTSNSRCGAG